MAFTLNRKDGQPYYGKVTHNDKPNDTPKEEIVENEIEQNPVESQQVLNSIPASNDIQQEANQVTNGNPKDSEVRNDVVEKELNNNADFFDQFMNGITKEKQLPSVVVPNNYSKQEEKFKELLAKRKAKTQLSTVNNPPSPIVEEKPLDALPSPNKTLDTLPQGVLQKIPEEKKIATGELYDIAEKKGKLPPLPEDKNLFIPIPGKNPNPTPQNVDVPFSPKRSPISFEEAKQVLGSITSGGFNLTKPTVSGKGVEHSADDKSFDITGKSGHTQVYPKEGQSTSTGPISPTTQKLRDIMSGITTAIGWQNQSKGSGDFKYKGMPSIHGGSNKNPTNVAGKPLKLVGKTLGAENVYEKIVDIIKRKYSSWPKKDGEYTFEKGLIRISVDDNRNVKIKYGSYRLVLLETFAKQHNNLLKNILSVLQ